MVKPRYTDKHRYPHGYMKSQETDITKSWARARERIEGQKQERAEKVREIRRIGVKDAKA